MPVPPALVARAWTRSGGTVVQSNQTGRQCHPDAVAAAPGHAALGRVRDVEAIPELTGDQWAALVEAWRTPDADDDDITAAGLLQDLRHSERWPVDPYCPVCRIRTECVVVPVGVRAADTRVVFVECGHVVAVTDE